MIHEGHS